MDKMRKHEPDSRNFVGGFARGLAVIEAFGNASEPLSLAAVAERAGVDRAVARRMLLTLVELGFAIQSNKTFQLTPRIMRLGYAFVSQAGLDGLVRPLLEALSNRLGESVSVSVLDDLEAVSVFHVTSPQRKTGFLLREGSRWPAYLMASGRVLLAALPDEEVARRFARMDLHASTPKTLTDPRSLLQAVRQAREHGYALVNEELETGWASVSVPVRDRAGRVVASLNTNTTLARQSPEQLVANGVPLLSEAAADLGRILPDRAFG
ncbi:MAG: IclR family transcriptional regulator C-terminal domain-containing protein [Pigmentiphaga sp.]|uniref:IclR family transcriptional regulator domain-containing protein n=1 Tax=Pigmentiphaga sp. TaxID=1977564 RepID=UPI00299FA28A|nr:IclR family transcriptional regulator C-terminal domain-containing protein [Pigmentiphaga sp.]MDX3905736.1 IclR family transcriptional regulator C-terminal domain-containing protein [Pigmentiphaga sp.]